eukprot:3160033-Rhodomonas_salina.1
MRFGAWPGIVRCLVVHLGGTPLLPILIQTPATVLWSTALGRVRSIRGQQERGPGLGHPEQAMHCQP